MGHWARPVVPVFLLPRSCNTGGYGYLETSLAGRLPVLHDKFKAATAPVATGVATEQGGEKSM
jgi:hypothetical protein